MKTVLNYHRVYQQQNHSFQFNEQHVEELRNMGIFASSLPLTEYQALRLINEWNKFTSYWKYFID